MIGFALLDQVERYSQQKKKTYALGEAEYDLGHQWLQKSRFARDVINKLGWVTW